MTRPSTQATPPSTLRRRLRGQRRALTLDQQREAARRLDRIVAPSALFQRSRHIAFFIANDGELNPQLLLQRAWRRGKTCYLPVIAATNSLWFARYEHGDPLTPNRFGILEPARAGTTLVPARILDLILTPLVAFDDHGNRLGMGSGFYDRTLSFLRHRRTWRKPRLLGIAHELQHIVTLQPAPWDVALDGVATDKNLYLFRNT